MSASDRDRDEITVHVPGDLPVLSVRASRILLAILKKSIEREVPEEPREGGDDDC